MENYSEKKVLDIRERAIQYALRAIKLYQYIEKETGDTGKILGKQYLRSATSIGANIEEAQAAESRNDFIHKLSISCKEARESLYWLTLFNQSGLISKAKLSDITRETDEIIAILTSIVKNLKK